MIGYTLWKSPKCITRQTLTRNPLGQNKRDRSKKSLLCESEADTERMDSNWEQLEKRT